MNITEAVNMILKRYPNCGYDVFMDLSKIKDDDLQEAVRFIKSMRRSYCVEPKCSKEISWEMLNGMIKKGYTYKDIARETGLSESTVGARILNYGLRELYHQMHPDVRGTSIPVICLNVETDEQKTFDTIGAAERAFGFRKDCLGYRIRKDKCCTKNGWVFRRAN